ncbi:MAG: iron-siderophore ABC transporter substrate-binding protein [Rhizonema sp. PD37]|nr:iron-siderophore ABC transporter substrate-binding protein [Rhizonema sp. PD37]
MILLMQLLLVGLLMLGMVSGCSYDYQQAHSLAPRPATTTNTVRIFKHGLEQTRVSLHPDRVVILDTPLLEDALALGVKPVGGPLKWLDWLQIDPLTAKDIIEVGGASLPINIEKILALKPDLILGLEDNQNIYPLLSHIAPTVLMHINSVRDWKSHFLQMATVLGKTERAQKVIALYQSRLRSFKASMGARLTSTRASIISVNNGIVRLFLRDQDSFSRGIFEDAGLAQQISPISGGTDHHLKIRSAWYLISSEELLSVDYDVIFDFTFDKRISHSVSEHNQKTIKQIGSTSLGSKLKAVQHGQVYPVGIYWIGSGPISANLALDDLFKYLLPLTEGHGQ